ncbi:hypothetical protein STANM309S_03352 [Streptomyces tanashiensis]
MTEVKSERLIDRKKIRSKVCGGSGRRGGVSGRRREVRAARFPHPQPRQQAQMAPRRVLVGGLREPLRQELRGVPPHLPLRRGDRRERGVGQRGDLVVVRRSGPGPAAPARPARPGAARSRSRPRRCGPGPRSPGPSRRPRAAPAPPARKPLRVRLRRYGVDDRARLFRPSVPPVPRRSPRAPRARSGSPGGPRAAASRSQREQVAQGEQHAVGVVGGDPVQAVERAAGLGAALQEDRRHGQLGQPVPVREPVLGAPPAGRDERALGARREEALGAGAVLLRPVVGDPRREPRPGAGRRLVRPRMTSAK